MDWVRILAYITEHVPWHYFMSSGSFLVAVNSDIQWLTGIQVYIPLREGDHNTVFVELVVDHLVQFRAHRHTVLLRADKAAQFEIQ